MKDLAYMELLYGSKKSKKYLQQCSPSYNKKSKYNNEALEQTPYQKKLEELYFDSLEKPKGEQLTLAQLKSNSPTAL